MLHKSRIWVVALLATGLSLLSAGATFASSPAAVTNYAMAPASGWVQLNPGQSQWYQFHTDAAPSDATDKRILVELTGDPQGSAAFTVWTAQALQASQAGDTTAMPIGDGSAQVLTDGRGSGNTYDLNGGDLMWASTSTSGQDFFVDVQSTASVPTRYMLKISGNYVSFPGMPASAARIIQASTSAQMPPMLLPATGQMTAPAAAGSGTNNPFMLDGQARALGLGQSQWYAFQHTGPDADGTEATASIVLNAYPQGSATFKVWTPAELQALAAGDTTNGIALAQGTLHQAKDGDTTFDRFGGNLEWAGKLGESGTFYVQVLQTGTTPSSYSLQFSQQ